MSEFEMIASCLLFVAMWGLSYIYRLWRLFAEQKVMAPVAWVLE